MMLPADAYVHTPYDDDTIAILPPLPSSASGSGRQRYAPEQFMDELAGNNRYMSIMIEQAPVTEVATMVLQSGFTSYNTEYSSVIGLHPDTDSSSEEVELDAHQHLVIPIDPNAFPPSFDRSRPAKTHGLRRPHKSKKHAHRKKKVEPRAVTAVFVPPNPPLALYPSGAVDDSVLTTIHQEEAKSEYDDDELTTDDDGEGGEGRDQYDDEEEEEVDEVEEEKQAASKVYTWLMQHQSAATAFASDSTVTAAADLAATRVARDYDAIRLMSRSSLTDLNNLVWVNGSPAVRAEMERLRALNTGGSVTGGDDDRRVGGAAKATGGELETSSQLLKKLFGRRADVKEKVVKRSRRTQSVAPTSAAAAAAPAPTPEVASIKNANGTHVLIQRRKHDKPVYKYKNKISI